MRADRSILTVLVVEDEWLVRMGIADEFKSAGWKILETSSAEGAIALLRAGQHIDVLFTDIQLAGYLSGWDLADVFRQERTAIPVIYTSGNSVDRSRAVEGSLFFGKPYRPGDVIEACCKLS